MKRKTFIVQFGNMNVMKTTFNFYEAMILAQAQRIKMGLNYAPDKIYEVHDADHKELVWQMPQEQTQKELIMDIPIKKAGQIDRICKYCSYWQIDEHRPGDRVPEKFKGKCMVSPIPVERYEDDKACKEFEPVI